MKKILSTLLVLGFIFSCKPSNDSPVSTATLLSQKTWSLDQYYKLDGTPISNSELKPDAKFLYAMYFQFLSNGETRALDKSNPGNIINKGTWSLASDNVTMNINVTGFTGTFKIISISTSKLVLQAPTDNFISNVGNAVNLQFSAVVN